MNEMRGHIERMFPDLWKTLSLEMPGLDYDQKCKVITLTNISILNESERNDWIDAIDYILFGRNGTELSKKKSKLKRAKDKFFVDWFNSLCSPSVAIRYVERQ